MKERPILFSGPMVRAILEGRKTQTRRIVKVSRGYEMENDAPSWADFEDRPLWWPYRVAGDGEESDFLPSSYGQPGDRLWVRETTAFWWKDGKPDRVLGYRADLPGDAFESEGFGYDDPWWLDCTWRPSIFMPRWASRITLEIVSVRVERLQEISEEDALCEGIRELPLQEGQPGAWWTGSVEAGSKLHARTPVAAYRLLWESINGPGSWDANPWVWVVELKRVEHN